MKKIFLLLLLSLQLPCFAAEKDSKRDVEAFRTLPVLHEGRIKPIDTVARNTLLFIHGKQRIQVGSTSLSATEWLMAAMMDPAQLEEVPFFRIDNPDVLGILHKEPSDGKYYSIDDLIPYANQIQTSALEASKIETAQQNSFQRAVCQLFQKLKLYLLLSHTLQLDDNIEPEEEIGIFQGALRRFSNGDNGANLLLADLFERYRFLAESAQIKILAPLQQDDEWYSIGEGLLMGFHLTPLHPGILPLLEAAYHYPEEDPTTFNENVFEYRKILKEHSANLLGWSQFEVFFNDLQPFLKAIALYYLSFLLIAISWCWSWKPLPKIAWLLTGIAFLFHTTGLVTRMILQGRPPVTNLYSSAIFVGWIAVLACILLEKRLAKGFGIAVGATIGGTTLIIAHQLQGGQDSIEMMRAVLDSNFWLSTHVVAITTGYSATYVAGMLAIFSLFRRLFVGEGDETSEKLSTTVYGVTCFALFFAIVGTVLGGIWADQSWGRFWGWDPKENGALLIVLWNAMLLHARWGRMVANHSFMALVVLGNIITSLSWFGVNLLGVGLHSYGFMEGPFTWLVCFAGSQVLLASLALLPARKSP